MLTIIKRNRQEIENAGGLYVYRLILAAVIAFYAVILAAVVLLAATTAEAKESGKNATRTEQAKQAARRKEDRKNEKVIRDYIRRKYGKRYKADIRNADNITEKDIRNLKGKKKVRAGSDTKGERKRHQGKTEADQQQKNDSQGKTDHKTGRNRTGSWKPENIRQPETDNRQNRNRQPADISILRPLTGRYGVFWCLRVF